MLFAILKRALAAMNLKLFRYNQMPRGMVLDLDLKRLFRRHPPTVIFDVGANLGQSALRFARLSALADIYAFEPIEATYRDLVQRVGGHSRIHCHRLALGEKTGETLMLYGQGGSGTNRRVDGSSRITEEVEKVPIMELDAFCLERDIKHIDLLKIDCEGYDLEVLHGAEGLLVTGGIDVIYCEVNFQGDGLHADFYEVASYLRGRGYMFSALYEYFCHREVGCFSNALFVRKSFWQKSLDFTT